jgi:hypothetical protein
LLGRVHRGPGTDAVLDERKFEHLESGPDRFEARKQRIRVEQVPDHDEPAFARVEAAYDFIA